jgi:hypothetical protein
MDDSVNYDYALFGSSRCIYNINPSTIDLETGLRGINLGYSGSYPLEIKLMVKKFLEKYKPMSIFIQVDDTYNKEISNPVSITSWMPFINNDYIYKEILRHDNNAFYLKNIPFYRYLKYESKIGFRNVLLGYLKENKFNGQKGFTDIRNEMNEVEKVKYVLKDKPNIHLKEIQKWGEEKGVKIYFFTAPYIKRDINTEVLEKQLTNYNDFSQIFSNAELFSDPNHLNWKGAKQFTDIFINHYFN